MAMVPCTGQRKGANELRAPMTIHEAENRVLAAIAELWPDYWLPSAKRHDRLREEFMNLSHDGTEAGRIFLLYWALFGDFVEHSIPEALLVIREHEVETVADLVVLYYELSEEYRTANLEDWNK